MLSSTETVIQNALQHDHTHGRCAEETLLPDELERDDAVQSQPRRRCVGAVGVEPMRMDMRPAAKQVAV